MGNGCRSSSWKRGNDWIWIEGEEEDAGFATAQMAEAGNSLSYSYSRSRMASSSLSAAETAEELSASISFAKIHQSTCPCVSGNGSAPRCLQQLGVGAPGWLKVLMPIFIFTFISYFIIVLWFILW
ncbi:hypothetical protein KSP39_PZI010758 [Platanthera zijinensis]|uniref:Uncharacterized protein n=1 Tax=Platanthera zijinensis TaxID=2320716 RepID=A0AAP0G6X8_9ASPA